MHRGLLGGSKTEPFLGHLGSEEQRGGGGVRPGEQKLPGQIAWLALPRALAVPLSLFSSLSLYFFFFFFTGNAFFLKVSRRRQAAQCSQTAVARRNLRRF